MKRRVEFAEEINPWSEYVAEDGTRFRARMILISIHCDDAVQSGPCHEFQFQYIVERIKPPQKIISPITKT